jgi:hypothetical protein
MFTGNTRKSAAVHVLNNVGGVRTASSHWPDHLTSCSTTYALPLPEVPSIILSPNRDAVSQAATPARWR